MSVIFKPRKTAPGTNDKNWLHTSKGGFNSCILISGNSCLPNCVGYAWGRFRELLGYTPKLCRGNAENWYSYKDGYKRGKTPKLGAVICYAKGKAGNASDGAGHVAIVEEIYPDGSILVSQSVYGGARFGTKKLAKGYAWGSLTFQGFIYPPVDFATDQVEYYAGYIKTLCDLNLHSLPSWDKSTNYGVAKKGTVLQVVGRIKVEGVYMYKLTNGKYITSATKYVTYTASNPNATIKVNSKVRIKSGAVYGGLGSSRGKKVSDYALSKTCTVIDIQINKGVKEAKLKEINSWVAVSSLTLV